ncbi:ChaN family lipoprotein [Maridesulfovibrio frigidus]|uniref:ChaN family lipoprotein n=1 Tax=Maridesulfovibrio frigidus TaxID=340956 RepID=UPI0004E0B619|nr:ChaN family lipoprotein [Maridesulfovibrio frigidus]
MFRYIIHIRARGLTALCALFFIFAASGCTKVVHPEMAVSFLPCPGEYVDTAGNKISYAQVVGNASNADYVLIGEGHTSRCDHEAQFNLIQGLTRNNRKVAIGLEMVNTEKQDVLNRYNLGQLPIDKLEESLDWENQWRYDFKFFQPIFELAKARKLTVAALNFPFRITKEVRAKGLEGLNATERSLLPEKVIPPDPKQEESLKEILAMHAGRDSSNSTQVERFFLVQSLWDTAMAEQAVSLHRNSELPVVILAGAGHVEHGWGIAHRLKELDPEANIFMFMPWRGEEFYPTAADSFFYCPPAYESRLGMTIEMRQGKAVIVAVKRDRKAYKFGIRPGDVLLKAQGIPVHSLTAMHVAGRKAHKDKKPLIFKMDRRGKTFDVDLGLLVRDKKE